MTNSLTVLRPRNRPPVSGRTLSASLPDGIKRMLEAAEVALAQPFVGITTDGKPVPGLFSLQQTGSPTAPIRQAAEAFLSALTPPQRKAALFPLDSDAWRRWSNIHPFLMRHGILLDALTLPQQQRALALLRTCLSLAGFEAAQNVMRLNETIREITGRDEEYGEWLYWLSIMGTPSSEAPWGWQLDGHHLIINCFILQNQMVLTPMFMGSEPTAADTGKYAGTRVFEAEEENGLAVVRALTPQQLQRTILAADLPNEVFTTAFRDNFELRYEGICYGELTSGQQALLLRVLDTYVGRLRPGHAQVKMEEVRRHLEEMHFAWMGSVDEHGVFYYRVHSPVILIEFDHQRGIALDNDVPSRQHIHTVVRTPNGNDYGMDLLRQHRQQFDHARV
jgi:Protein of unknown function (DUF3500)